LKTILSADFLDERGTLIFPDIALDAIAGAPHISHRFLERYASEYEAAQLQDADVLLSLKPRVTANSLEGVTRLCAIARFGVGYDNVDLAACTERDIAVYITRQAVVRPVASSIVLLVLAASHNLVWKDRMIRRGDWAGSTRVLGREPRGRVVGTVGFGNIAREAIRLLRPFEVARFLAFDPALTPGAAQDAGVAMASLEEIFDQSDYARWTLRPARTTRTSRNSAACARTRRSNRCAEACKPKWPATSRRRRAFNGRRSNWTRTSRRRTST
jgi:phosphoglycerate dehydrogenase-like enzyme